MTKKTASYPGILILRSCLVVAALFTAEGFAFAQASPTEPPPRKEGSVEFAYVATTGNTDTTTLGFGGEFFYRPQSWIFVSKIAYVRSASGDVVNAESSRFLIRADRKLAERLTAFGIWNYLHDVFANLDRRDVIAGGISFRVLGPAPQELWLDVGLGHTKENRVRGGDLSTATMIIGGRYKFKLSETAEIADEVALVSSSKEEASFLTNVASVTAKLTAILSLKASHTYRFVGEPQPGFEDTDTITAIALVAKF